MASPSRSREYPPMALRTSDPGLFPDITDKPPLKNDES